MKEFIPLKFDPISIKKELKEFQELLEQKENLSEQKEILPFFKQRLHLSAFIGSCFPNIFNFDRLAHEFSIFSDFSCDLAIGDSQTSTFCFVEFEDASPTSIFEKKKGKSTLEWSSRFEHGFSQIVDWFWKLDDMKNSIDFKSKFGKGYVKYYGLLILGRSSSLSYKEEIRLKWRLEKTLIDSKPVHCMTFDELYQTMDNQFRNWSLTDSL